MEQRELHFKTLDEAVLDAERLHQKGYERAGTWDLSQVLDHLGFFLNGAVDGYQFKVPWLIKVLFGRMVLKRILHSQKMKSGVFTPQKPLPPPGADEAKALERFRESVKCFTLHPGEYRVSPFFGKLTRDECRELNLIHCGHHLGYLIPRG